MIERADKTKRPADREQTEPTAALSSAGRADSTGSAIALGDAILQAKLAVGPAGDAFEREADAVAARVVKTIQFGAVPERENADESRVQRERLRQPDADGDGDAGDGDDGDESVELAGRVRRVQRAARVPAAPATTVSRVQRAANIGAAGGALDADTARLLESSRSSGRPLPRATRSTMESAFGADFGDIRVHSGATSTELNDRMQAKAFTTGRDIFFRDGVPDATTQGGQELLAHELTHTIQQGAAATQRWSTGGGRMQRVIQREIDSVAKWVDDTTKYRSAKLGWEYGRSDLFVAIDSALEDFHKSKDGWSEANELEVEGREPEFVNAVRQAQANARLSYIQATFELQRSILEWGASKLDDDGTLSSIRATEANALYVQVEAELAAIKASDELARPSDRASWDAEDAFSDTRAHDPENFRYVVNGVTPGADYRENIQADPSLYGENAGVISVSVIDQAKNSMWAPSGYILKVPSTSVIAAGAGDLASNSQLAKPRTTLDLESDRLSTKFGVLSPEEMTAQTSVTGHNEAAVVRDGLEVVGIFVVEDPDSEASPVKAYELTGRKVDGKDEVVKVPAVSDAWMENYRSVAAKDDIPIIWIRQAEGAGIGALKPMDMIPISSFDPLIHHLSEGG